MSRIQTARCLFLWACRLVSFLIIKRELPNVLIKFDGFLEPVPCLHYPAAHAGVAGEGESDSGNLGMYRLRPHQNGFRFLYTLDLPH